MSDIKQIPLNVMLPIFKLVHSASNDDYRPNLCGVNFDLLTGIGRATTGHYASEVNLGEEYTKEYGTMGVINIPKEACLYALKIKAKEHYKTLVEIHDKEIKIIGNSATVSFDLLTDISFPNIEEVTPKGNPVFTIGFNPEYLVELLKSMRENNKQTLAKLDFYGDHTTAIVVTVSGNKGLLMPMRVN